MHSCFCFDSEPTMGCCFDITSVTNQHTHQRAELFNEFEELSRWCAWGGAQSAMCLLRSSSTGLLPRPQVLLTAACCTQTSFRGSRLAWYDEEEEAMLRQKEGRAEGAVADEEEARTNANSSTAPSSSAVASASSPHLLGMCMLLFLR